MSKINLAVSEDRVRAVAHSLWIEEGMPEGRAENHWFKALELVNAESEAPLVKAKPKPKAPAAAAKKPAARKTSKS